ncbi:terminase large subunit domain-containing protein [Actinospongicola halichondriae]|uniref:terminase large subunit domain-containing protein n=1 Tax=Actinospongicola halichondriae TaxID=3236844 RepID=UPI003D50CFCE
MALKAGPKTKASVVLDRDDYDDDLAVARCQVMSDVFGIELYDWQKQVIADLGGQERPRTAYVQVPRKNGKTLLAAALVLTELILLPGRHIYGISDSERNLNSVLVRELRSLITGSELARNALYVSKAGIENPANGSFFEVRPGRYEATQGINPHLVIADELHLLKEQVWYGMAMAGAARDDALLFGITTPGYDLTSVAHDLYLQAQTADPETSDTYSVIHEAPPGSDVDDCSTWEIANPAYSDSFGEAMKLDHERLPEHEFRRFRLGQWTATDEAWLPYGAWSDRTDETRHLKPGDAIWIGFDGSYSGDSTALVAATADGFISVLGCWENPGVKGWRVPRDEVEEAVSDAFDHFDVRELICDPPYWEREIQEWQIQWPGRVIEFATNSRQRMAPACTTFYAAVMEGRITHDGDERLSRHLANAITKSSPVGDYITKPDRMSPAKIDLAVAAVLAYLRASRPVKPSYELVVA